MEATSLHLLDQSLVTRFVSAIQAPDSGPEWSAAEARAIARARSAYAANGPISERQVNTVTFALASLLALRSPTFPTPGAGLSLWEARVDRGAGMLLRPPSRLFIEAGLPARFARAMPIRLDPGAGAMGGAWIPARLVPELQRILDSRLERSVRRLVDAEMDPFIALGEFMAAADAAAAGGLGLYEAVNVLIADDPASWPPGSEVVLVDRKHLSSERRERIATAMRPPKQPGRLARLFGRGQTGRGSSQ